MMKHRTTFMAAVLALAVSLMWGISSAGPLTTASVPHPAHVAAPAATTAILYSQPPSPAGGLLLSSLRDPDGSANDQWIWDAFTLTRTGDITEFRWLGGYDPTRFGSGGRVANFTVSIYASIPAGTEPDVAHPPLVRYELGSNAGETPGAVLGGVQMYDYAFAPRTPFTAQGGTKYWVQIEAYQPGSLPDWGLARATGGDGSHYRKVAGETQYKFYPGDASFTLIGTQTGGLKIYLPVLLR